MKLDLFNRWKDFGTYYGSRLKFQTTRAPDTKNLFITYVKHAKTDVVVCKAYGMSDESSRENAAKLLNAVGVDGFRQAIHTEQPIIQKQPTKIEQARKNIENRADFESKKQPDKVEWLDGVFHRHRAQKKIVGEGKEVEMNKPRNPVAKNAGKFNKAGPMRDKKNDYNRKPKHKKRVED